MEAEYSYTYNIKNYKVFPFRITCPLEIWRTFKCLLCLFVHVCMCPHTLWRSENNPQELVLSSHFVSPENQAPVIRLGNKHPYLLSPLSGPGEHLFCVTVIYLPNESTKTVVLLLSETQVFHHTLVNLMVDPTCPLRYNFCMMF